MHEHKTANVARVRWGIVGCGDVTEKKSGPAFNQIEGSELVAVMRRNAVAAEDYAKRHAVPRWYDDADALIADPEVDAVYIATPPESHTELALKVAAAGKPCYVEKPMARTAAECQQMIEAFKAAGQPLFVAYYRRALPHFTRIRECILSGELGQLRQLTYDFANSAQLDEAATDGWRFDPKVAGGGLFWDLGSHVLDLFDYLAGALVEVSGHLANVTGRGAVEELAALQASTTSGVSIVASWNFVSPQPSDRMILRFEHGEIECSVFGAPIIIVTDADGSHTEETFELPTSIQQPLIANVVAALREGASPLSTGDSAARTNAVIDAVSQ